MAWQIDEYTNRKPFSADGTTVYVVTGEFGDHCPHTEYDVAYAPAQGVYNPGFSTRALAEAWIAAHPATDPTGEGLSAAAFIAKHGSELPALSRDQYEARCAAAGVECQDDAFIASTDHDAFFEGAAANAQAIVWHRLMVARLAGLVAEGTTVQTSLPTIAPATAELAAAVATGDALARDEAPGTWGPKSDMSWAEYLASDGEPRR